MINTLKTKTERQLEQTGYQHNNAVSGKDSLSSDFYSHKLTLSHYIFNSETKQGIALKVSSTVEFIVYL